MSQMRRKKHSAAIPILIGIVAILVVLLIIMVCTIIGQQSQMNKSAAISGNQVTADTVSNSGYPAEYQIQFEQECYECVVQICIGQKSKTMSATHCMMLHVSKIS